MYKQLNLLYFSANDKTAQVVKAVANGLDRDFKEYNITLPHNREHDIFFSKNDLVIIGVPVYTGRVPAFLINYFQKVKGDSTPSVFIVVYGNRDYDDALLELKDTLEKNGFIGIAGGAFIGEHSFTDKVGTGRPDQADLKTAHKFGADIKEKLSTIGDISNLPGLKVKGNFPYEEKRPLPRVNPETSDQCINCGTCANHCPMGAIDFSDFSKIDDTKCIGCYSCINRCPVGAKSINHELHNKLVQKLIEYFGTVRHEPEIFI